MCVRERMVSLSSGVWDLVKEYSLGIGNISLASPMTLSLHIAGGDGSSGGGLVCSEILSSVPWGILFALYHLLR
jgi:hypothetical protein